MMESAMNDVPLDGGSAPAPAAAPPGPPAASEGAPTPAAASEAEAAPAASGGGDVDGSSPVTAASEDPPPVTTAAAPAPAPGAPAAAPPAAPAPPSSSSSGGGALFDAAEEDEEEEADLFGALPPAGAGAASRLAASGLLGDTAGGGGLFADVDREAEEKAERDAEEAAERAKKAEEEERARVEAERAAEEARRQEEERARAVAAQEAAMAQAQAQQQAQQQQQQAQQQGGMQGLQQGMAGMALGGAVGQQPNGTGAAVPQANGNSAPAQQPSAATPGGRPLSFAERSAAMQAQAAEAQKAREAQMQAAHAAQLQQQAQMQQQMGGPPPQQGYIAGLAAQAQAQQQQQGMQASYMYSTAGGPQQQQPAQQPPAVSSPPLGAQQARGLPGAVLGGQQPHVAGQQQPQPYAQGAGGMHGRYYDTPQQPAPPQPQQQQVPPSPQVPFPHAQPGMQHHTGHGGAGGPMGQNSHYVHQPPPHQTYAQTRRNPSLLAGLHNGSDPTVPPGSVAGALPSEHPQAATMQGMQGMQPGMPGVQQAPPQTLGRALPLPPPARFEPLYGQVSVSDPLLVQSHGLFAGPPHWAYAVTVRVPGDTQPRGGTTIRRRFRHFVALEDRLRETCPGAILPPRPDKHPTRAIEEASTRQSANFAMQRSSELEEYLNALVRHPIAGSTDVLRLFLTLQDDVGTAWPEVSSSALTRLGAMTSVTASKAVEGTTAALQDLQVDQKDAGEDDAELLALAASEGLRIGSVVQAVPKIEGALALVRDQGERSGVVGLEMSKLAKDVSGEDADLSGSLDLLSSALLRSGRRTKRLAVELSAAAAPFVSQYKLCRYERMAFEDRRAALSRRTAARSRADGRAQKLVMHQSNMSSLGRPGYVERMEMEASLSDESAVAALREADVVGMTLRREVARVSEVRKTEWSASLKVLASSMREACAERTSIWESAREQFRTEFPDYEVQNPDLSVDDVPVPTPVN